MVRPIMRKKAQENNWRNIAITLILGMRLAAAEHATVHQDRVWGAVRVCTCAAEGDADNVITKTSRARLHDIVGFSPEGESYNTQTRAESRRHAGFRANRRQNGNYPETAFWEMMAESGR
jgi:hypothetical protein